MKSFGFWLESEDKSDIEPLSIDVLLNFNLWCEPSSGAGRDLDFGFKLSRAVDSEGSDERGPYSIPKHVKAFVLYCPFSLDKKHVFDLYDVLISSQSRVLGAVFNEKCKVTSTDSKPYASVEFLGGSNDSFTLCKIANSISIEDTPDDVPGCFIRITLPSNLPGGALYFDFALKALEFHRLSRSMIQRIRRSTRLFPELRLLTLDSMTTGLFLIAQTTMLKLSTPLLGSIRCRLTFFSWPIPG